MFDPSKVDETKLNERLTKQACMKIKTMVEERLPKNIDIKQHVSVREIICGDPECAPIDTLVELWFGGDEGDEEESNHQGFAFPLKAIEITEKDIEDKMPPLDIIEQWQQGLDPEYPFPEPPPSLQLRFDLNEKVEVLVGSESSSEGSGHWESGNISQLWYRDRSWPLWAYVPYLVTLGLNQRDTYVVSDLETRIRAHPSSTMKKKYSSSSTSSSNITLTIEKEPEVDKDIISNKRQKTQKEKENEKEGGEEGAAAEEEEGEDDGDEDYEDDENYALYDKHELPHTPSWRFNIGDEVLCYVGGDEGWQKGKVQFIDEQDPEEENWFLIPYVVKLHDDTLISVPYDNDFTIKPIK